MHPGGRVAPARVHARNEVAGGPPGRWAAVLKDTRRVLVQIELPVGVATTPRQVAALHRAARTLTNDLDSVQVTFQETPEEGRWIAEFSIRTAPQYQIVNALARSFRMYAEPDCVIFDMSIRFPKPPRVKRTRRRHFPQ